MTSDHNDMTTAAVISRLVDGEGTSADWQSFRAMAERDPSLWRELAECQQDHAELAAAVNHAIAIADEVDVDVQSEMTRRFSERMRLVASWGGWAAAAAIVLVWATGMQNAPSTATSPATAGLPGPLAHQNPDPLTANDAFNQYIEKGKEQGFVVGEVPTRVMLEARPLKAGGYDVLYLRQVLERRTVKEISTLATDEWGDPVPVSTTLTPLMTRDPAKGAGPF